MLGVQSDELRKEHALNFHVNILKMVPIHENS